MALKHPESLRSNIETIAGPVVFLGGVALESLFEVPHLSVGGLVFGAVLFFDGIRRTPIDT